MNRRGFLKLFSGAAAGAIVLPKVSYFFAPQGGWAPRVLPGYNFGKGDLFLGAHRTSIGTLENVHVDVEATIESLFGSYTITPPGIWVGREAYEEFAKICDPAELAKRTSIDDGVLYIDLIGNPDLLDDPLLRGDRVFASGV